MAHPDLTSQCKTVLNIFPLPREDSKGLEDLAGADCKHFQVKYWSEAWRKKAGFLGAGTAKPTSVQHPEWVLLMGEPEGHP